MQAALVASTLWNVNVKPQHRLKAEDFMLEFGAVGKEQRGMTQEEILAHIKARFVGGARG